MKILTTSTNAQTISVIPRLYTDTATLSLRDDSTNTVVSYNLVKDTDYVVTRDKMVITQAFSLTEGRFYDLKIEYNSEAIYKDKVFCTDQTVDQDQNDYYDINKDVYTSDTSYDNDYVILWV